MSIQRQELSTRLLAHYRSQGWVTREEPDGTVRADGPGGVTWIGAAVTAEDLSSGSLEERLPQLADQRKARGELCPLELLPAVECAGDLEGLLARLGLAERRHIAVYSSG